MNATEHLLLRLAILAAGCWLLWPIIKVFLFVGIFCFEALYILGSP